jgi:hypothetical protein
VKGHGNFLKDCRQEIAFLVAKFIISDRHLSRQASRNCGLHLETIQIPSVHGVDITGIPIAG